jgi:hypothetical protein
LRKQTATSTKTWQLRQTQQATSVMQMWKCKNSVVLLALTICICHVQRDSQLRDLSWKDKQVYILINIHAPPSEGNFRGNTVKPWVIKSIAHMSYLDKSDQMPINYSMSICYLTWILFHVSAQISKGDTKIFLIFMWPELNGRKNFSCNIIMCHQLTLA